MSDLTGGFTFAGCRLETEAGRGGMGVVWKATQLVLNRPVALKAIAPDLARNAEFRDRFQRESQLAASIDHPNVIPVYEAGELDGTLYLIMRWVDGTDLRVLLRESGKLDPGRALRLLRPVASALVAAHRRGLIHRDIKPANVLIAQGDEQVYLTDFGIARLSSGEAMTRTGTLVGTIDYMAPERFEGGRGDIASDIYAFGCMLYETVTGRVPFDRPTDVSKLFAHINDPPPSARECGADVPDSVDTIIAKAMAKRPEDRFASATELEGALAGVLGEVDSYRQSSQPTQPRPAQKIGTRTRARPVGGGRAIGATTAVSTPRRQRYALSAAVALLVVVGAVIAAIAANGGGSSGRAASATAHLSAIADTASEVTKATGGLKPALTVKLPGVPGVAASAPRGGLAVSIPSSGQGVYLARGVPPAQVQRVGGHATALATAGLFGAWVGCAGPGKLARIGLVGELEAKAAGATQCPTALAANMSDGSVWAGYPDGHLIFYARSGRPIANAKLRALVSSIAVGEGSVWAVDGDLVRIDPHSGAQRSFNMGAGSVSVALDGGVWVAHAGGFLTRFDPRPGNLNVNVDITVAPALKQVAAVEGDPTVWAIGNQTLYKISGARTAGNVRVTGSVTFRSPSVALVVSGPFAWVATADGELVRISG